MKKIVLLTIVLALWNCKKTETSKTDGNDSAAAGNVDSTASSTNDGEGIAEEETMELKINDNSSEKSILTVAPIDLIKKELLKSGKAFSDNEIYEKTHGIQDSIFEKNITDFKSHIKQGGKSYLTKLLHNDSGFISTVNDPANQNKFIKFELPATKNVYDIKISVTDNYCDFKDGVSVYEVKFLKYLLSKKYDEFKLIKGYETIDDSRVQEYCNKQNIKKTNIAKVVEAQFYLKLQDGTDKYYNVSHIPPPNIKK